MDVQLECELLEKDVLKSNRLSDYKPQATICDQETRRFRLLENQKKKREETLNAFRNVTEVFSQWDDLDPLEDETQNQDVEFREWTQKLPGLPRVKGLLTLSEWMVKVPDNLEDKWLFTLCPVGKRCLVRSSKGFTIAFGKRGQRFIKFQSALPNGSVRDYTGTKYSNSEVTLLDCIWCPSTKTYFVLDLLSWKGQFYMDTETSFRGFWTKSKLQEMPWLSERTVKNPFPFIPLEHYPCDLETLSSVMSKHPYFPNDDPKVDGLLFYHSEAFYTPGITPLVLWLKPFMVPEVLGFAIPEGYMLTKPISYIDSNHYITSYTEKRRLVERKHRRSKKKREEEEEEPRMEESLPEVEMMEK